MTPAGQRRPRRFDAALPTLDLRVWRQIMLGKQELAPWLQNPACLGQGGLWRSYRAECESADDGVEDSRVERQVFGFAVQHGDHKAGRPGRRLGDLAQALGRIDTCDAVDLGGL